MSKPRTRKQLEAAVGGLSSPSKMPCHGFSIPASRCIQGGALRKLEGSTCAKCYAFDRGRYAFDNVKAAMERRYSIMMEDLDSWVDNMAELLNRFEKSGFFRWHDSGDIQSVEHLEAIARIAMKCPDIQFWLPTREVKLVKTWLEQTWPKSYGGALARPNGLPRNLTIRVSSFFVGSAMKLPEILQRAGVKLSTVGLEDVTDDVHVAHCPASKQGNQCQSCRACWDRSVYTVNYHLH